MEKPRKGSTEGLPPVFEESFKLAVAREYLNGKLSQSQLARKYNLPSGDTVHYFLSWYRKWEKKHGLPVTGSQREYKNEISRMAKLEEELQQARLKITALEMTIQTAEDTLGIDIRKKSGTK